MLFKIQEDLVLDKHACDLVGYVDLGNKQLNAAALNKTKEFTSKCFSISSHLFSSIVNIKKSTPANFAAKSVTAF